MAKVLKLEKQWLAQFTESLAASPAIGRLALQAISLTTGQLEVWVPDVMASLPPQELQQDYLQYEESFGVDEAIYSYFDQHLRNERNKLAIADTHRSVVGEQEKIEVSWFLLNPPSQPERIQVCAYISGSDASPGAYDSFLNEASPYPKTIVLTSLDPKFTLSSGDYLSSESPVLKSLMLNVEHILLGVFDERSFMIWTRQSCTA